MAVGVHRHAPAALSSGKTRYPLYIRLGSPQGRSERVRLISPPPGFDPWTVQPVASRYTYYTLFYVFVFSCVCVCVCVLLASRVYLLVRHTAGPEFLLEYDVHTYRNGEATMPRASSSDQLTIMHVG
jgi:hypothetical protein